jgi:hypothetical protein
MHTVGVRTLSSHPMPIHPIPTIETTNLPTSLYQLSDSAALPNNRLVPIIKYHKLE